MKTLNGKSDTGLPPNGTPGQLLGVDITSQPVWESVDLGLTTVNFNDSPYLTSITTFSGRTETTQINLNQNGDGQYVLTSDNSDTLNLAFKSITTPEKVTVEADPATESYTLRLPAKLEVDEGYLKVRANGSSFIEVPKSALFFSTAAQALAANTQTTILFPSITIALTSITYNLGTFTVAKTCVAMITASIPVASTNSRKNLFILKNTSIIRYGETSINDVPASVESLQTNTILNFDAGDTFRVVMISTSNTTTTISGSSVGHCQIYLL